MYGRGAVVSLLVVGALMALDEPQKDGGATRDLQSLFSNAGPLSSVDPIFPAIDLEEFLEGSPEIGREFRTLSQEDKDMLFEMIVIINRAFSSALYSVLSPAKNSSDDLSDCGCLSVLAEITE